MKGFLKSLLIILMLASNGYQDTTHKSQNSKSTQKLKQKKASHIEETPEVLCAKNRNTLRLFPHPKRSTKFFLCVDGKPIIMNCPLGESFNPTRKICERANNGKCKDTGNNAKHDDILQDPSMDNIANEFIKRVSSFQISSQSAGKNVANRNDGTTEANTCKSTNTSTTNENGEESTSSNNATTTSTTKEVECKADEIDKNNKTTEASTCKSSNTTATNANSTLNTTTESVNSTNSECTTTSTSTSSSNSSDGTQCTGTSTSSSSEPTNSCFSGSRSEEEEEEEKLLLKELSGETDTNTTQKACGSNVTTISTTSSTRKTTDNSSCLSLRKCRSDSDDIYFLPHVEDDRKYILCDSGRRVDMLCPDGRHFNPNANFCESSGGEI